MFKRRKKKAAARRLRGMLWPEMGWRRFWRYAGHRLMRLPGTPYAIAAGVACGAAISFTPLIGLHVALGVILARMIGASMVAALIGTVLGNPWTFPLIWVWIYKLGTWLGAAPEPSAAPGHAFRALVPDILDAVIRFDVKFLVAEVWPIFAPMLVGGAVTGAVTWILVFLLLKPTLEIYQNRRAARRSAKSVRIAEHET